MNLVIIEVAPNFGKGAVVDSFPVELGSSAEGVEVLKLSIVWEPPGDFRFVNVFVSSDISPDRSFFGNSDGFSFEIGKDCPSS